MDNFIDKLAQKFNAEELIRANTQAENAQMENLKLQASENEKVLQEMRKLNYKNVELSAKMEELLGTNSTKIASLQADELKILELLREITDEQNSNREELKLRDEKLEEEKEAEARKTELRDQKKLEAIEELIKKSDDFNHKEDVKVYRNVQAVIIEELRKQSEEQAFTLKKIKSRVTVAVIFSVFSFVLIIAAVALYVLMQLGILVF